MALEDIGRWVLLGAYIGKHGEKGKLRLSEKSLCQLLRCDDLNVTIAKIHNVLKQRDISNGKDIVTFKNWHKYQVDNSSERVAKYRQNVTVQEENKNKKRIRREKDNGNKPPPQDFILSLKENPAYKEIDLEKELAKMDAWLSLPKNKGRKKTPKFVLNWLNKIDVSLPITQTKRFDEKWGEQ
jgi:hypothetical protein